MVMRVLWMASIGLALWTSQGEAACTGDCDGNRAVTVDEVVLGVNIALGTASPQQCSNFDANHDQLVTVDEVVSAVSNALSGCPADGPTPTPTPPPTATATSGSATPGICDNGTWTVTYSDVPAGTNATTTDLTLDFVSGAVANTVALLGGAECPRAGNNFDRSLQISLFFFNGPGTYHLDGILSKIVYGESGSPNIYRIWQANSGDVIVDSFENKHLVFHFSIPFPPSKLGYNPEPPRGTFTLNVNGVINQTTP